MSKKTVRNLIVILLLIAFCFLFLFSRSQETITKAEKEAIALVEVDYPIKQVKQFYWVTVEDDEYFSMTYIDEDKKLRYAIINQKGGDVTHFDGDELINSDQAEQLAIQEEGENLPKKLLNTRLTLFKKRPSWEVSFIADDETMTYYYIDAKTGDWLQKIEGF